VPALPPRAEQSAADVTYFGVRRLLEAAGVAFPAACEVTDADSIDLAASMIGDGPYVLKAAHLLHKSDAGGVVLGIADVAGLHREYGRMRARLGATSYSIEALAPAADGVELIVGVRADPRFGPVAMIGLGGVHAEILGELVFALAPVPVERALDLLRGLRSAAVLAGARGRPAVDLEAAARAVEAITACAAAHPDIAELEVNPLLVTPGGAVALDARAVRAADAARAEPR